MYIAVGYSVQYMVREHLVELGNEHQRKAGHGMVRPDEMLSLRWNSQFGSIFVDGSHFKVLLDTHISHSINCC